MRSHFEAQSLMRVWGSGSQSGRQAHFFRACGEGAILSTRGRHRPIVLHDPLRQGLAWMTGVPSLTAPLPPLRCYGEHLPSSRGLQQSWGAGLEPGQSSGDKWIPVFSPPSGKGTAENALTGKSLVLGHREAVKYRDGRAERPGPPVLKKCRGPLLAALETTTAERPHQSDGRHHYSDEPLELPSLGARWTLPRCRPTHLDHELRLNTTP